MNIHVLETFIYSLFQRHYLRPCSRNLSTRRWTRERVHHRREQGSLSKAVKIWSTQLNPATGSSEHRCPWNGEGTPPWGDMFGQKKAPTYRCQGIQEKAKILTSPKIGTQGRNQSVGTITEQWLRPLCNCESLSEDFKSYPKCTRNPLKSFEQGYDVIGPRR